MGTQVSAVRVLHVVSPADLNDSSGGWCARGEGRAGDEKEGRKLDIWGGGAGSTQLTGQLKWVEGLSHR